MKKEKFCTTIPLPLFIQKQEGYKGYKKGEICFDYYTSRIKKSSLI